MAGNDISVLIVDDEEMVRSILQDFLDDEGFETDIAGTGREGLDLLDSKNFKAAIVDMSLPDMNGNEFIKKALEKYCNDVDRALDRYRGKSLVSYRNGILGHYCAIVKIFQKM